MSWDINSRRGSHQVTWKGSPIGSPKDTREEAQAYKLRLKDRYPHGADSLVGIYALPGEIHKEDE